MIGSQAFQESPKRHAPAIVIALAPSIAAWGKTQIDNALGAAANIHDVTPDMIAAMSQSGVLYQGLSILGGGSILAGVMLGAITSYMIDRDFLKAAGFSVAAAVLTFFGLMHGQSVGIGQTPLVAASYLIVGGLLTGTAIAARRAPRPVQEEASLAEAPAVE